jgi:hypothetical protein
MTCTNTGCSIFTVCQKKDRLPACPGSVARIRIVHNGYATMAMQEYSMRSSAIDFTGDHDV